MERTEFPKEQDFSRHVTKRITSLILELLKKQDNVSIFLAGGSTPADIYKLLKNTDNIPWGKILFFCGDERWSPNNNEIQNSEMIIDSLYNSSPLPFCNFFPVPQLETPELSASEYQETIEDTLYNSPPDIFLLGMGPDGHTASLFPDNTVTESSIIIAAPAPKLEPHVQRISCNYGFINSAKHLIFMVRKKGKEDMLEKVFNGGDYPVNKVKGVVTSEWFLLGD